MSNFLKPEGDEKNHGGIADWEAQVKTVDQFSDSQMYFSVIWTKPWKFLPITVELQIWEKIQQTFRREIEP